MKPKRDTATKALPEDCTMIAPPQRPLHLQPRLVLAHSDSVYATLSARRFRRLGWDVSVVGSSDQVRHLARAIWPDILVLDVDLRDESGWLTCEKLVREDPGAKVILLGRHVEPMDHRFADFVGASALVSQEDGIQALIDEVHGAVLAAAG